jgi:selenocysteine-specific elongation factor
MAKVTFFTSSMPEQSFFTQEFEYQQLLLESGPISTHSASMLSAESVHQYALLEFEKPLVCPAGSKVIGSRLDTDAFSNKCRIAFHGNLLEQFGTRDYESSILPTIRVFKLKRREGIVDRVCASYYL